MCWWPPKCGRWTVRFTSALNLWAARAHTSDASVAHPTLTLGPPPNKCYPSELTKGVHHVANHFPTFPGYCCCGICLQFAQFIPSCRIIAAAQPIAHSHKQKHTQYLPFLKFTFNFFVHCLYFLPHLNQMSLPVGAFRTASGFFLLLLSVMMFVKHFNKKSKHNWTNQPKTMTGPYEHKAAPFGGNHNWWFFALVCSPACSSECYYLMVCKQNGFSRWIVWKKKKRSWAFPALFKEWAELFQTALSGARIPAAGTGM